MCQIKEQKVMNEMVYRFGRSEVCEDRRWGSKVNSVQHIYLTYTYTSSHAFNYFSILFVVFIIVCYPFFHFA